MTVVSNEPNKDSIIVSKRFLAIAVVGLLFVYVLAFMSGYFWGKYSAMQELLVTCEEKALEHEVSNALYSLSLNQNEKQKEQLASQDVVTLVTVENQELEQGAEATQSKEDAKPQNSSENLERETKNDDGLSMQESQNKGHYYAQLIGFNTKKAANAFLQRAQKNSTIQLILKERVSEGIKNKKKRWYQVVTQPYEDKEVLEKDIKSLIQKEKLTGVTIAVYA